MDGFRISVGNDFDMSNKTTCTCRHLVSLGSSYNTEIPEFMDLCSTSVNKNPQVDGGLFFS